MIADRRLEMLPLQAFRSSTRRRLKRYLKEHAGELQDRAAIENALILRDAEFTVPGYCANCAKNVGFKVQLDRSPDPSKGIVPNWRESLICPQCEMNNRMRALMEFLEWSVTRHRFEDIYVTEQLTPFYRAARKRFPKVTGSEYIPDQQPAPGIRHEDLTRLSFDDSSFDVLCTADVLEHVPRYDVALSECFRCLKPGGAIFLSVPFIPDSEKTLVRARMNDDGTIEHLLPEEYHRDGLNPSGILCFYHFGWDLLARLSDAGFEKADAAFYWSRERAYLGSLQCVIEARKPKT